MSDLDIDPAAVESEQQFWHGKPWIFPTCHGGARLSILMTF